jgi:hypothetical protein
MSAPLTPVADWLEAWCAADRAAMQATRDATRKSLLALDRQGEPPSSAETAELKRLRATANALLRVVMARIWAPAGAC